MEDIQIKKYKVEINWSKIFKISSIFIIFYAIYKSYVYRWVCDDAFISFRYAKNFFLGHGLVFNQGEFVEGYTNYLWTILIYIGFELNLDPIQVSIYFGILFYFFTLIILYKISVFLNEKYSIKKFIFLPIALFCFAIQNHAIIFSTSGLEVSLFTFLLFTGLILILFSNNNYKILLGNFLLILALMTRPDGGLFYVFANIFIFFILIKENQFKNKILTFLFLQTPFLFIYLPYFIWKFKYYGWMFPNTYYAKSVSEIYFSQGLKYIILYFTSYYSFFLVLILSIFGIRKVKFQIYKIFYAKKFQIIKRSKTIKKKFQFNRNQKKKEISIQTKSFFLLFIPSIFYILFLLKIGGDFMFARLLIPISPLLLFHGEILSFQFTKKIKLFYSVLIITGFIFYYNPYKGLMIPSIDNITNENDIYKLKSVYDLKLKLLAVSKFIEEEEISISFGGSQAMVIYYLNPKIAIESTTGLTDEWIAHQELKSRNKVGHEKNAPISYLIKRKINIHFFPDNQTPKNEYNLFKIKTLPGEFRILKYDAASFENLAKTKLFQFVHFEKYLDKYIEDISNKNYNKVQKDYFEFKEYYFNDNEDFLREGKFKNYLRAIR